MNKMRTINEISKILTLNKQTKGGKIVFAISSFIATGCYIGKIKYAPGTFGSFLAILLCPIYITISVPWQIVVFFSLLIFGSISAHFYLIKIGNLKKDPKEVVIDEMVAIFFMILLSQTIIKADDMQYWHFALIFVLFRLFDIFKPYPISWVDKNVHGANGIMLDDLLAGIAGWFIFSIACKYIS